MAEDIFCSRLVQGGASCSAAAAAAAAAFCTCRRRLPLLRAQTDVSNPFRVYYWMERSSGSSHRHGARLGSRPVRSTAWSASQGAILFSSEVAATPTSAGRELRTQTKACRALPLFLIVTSGTWNKRSHPSSTSRSTGLQSCCPSRALYIATRSQLTVQKEMMRTRRLGYQIERVRPAKQARAGAARNASGVSFPAAVRQWGGEDGELPWYNYATTMYAA